MKFYFTLQYKMLNRQLRDFGLHPVLGYGLMLAAFVGFSLLLFSRTRFAPVIYIAAAVLTLAQLNETGRNNFLKSCFPLHRYRLLRLVENGFAALPFFIFLLYKHSFISALALLPLAAVLSLLQFNSKVQFVLPTPFYKYPFEFITGFRKSWWLFLLCYTLTIISISVDNLNLGFFSLGAAFLLCLSFYTTVEEKYYVWIFSLTPKKFLLSKIKTALFFSALLCLPLALSLFIFYPSQAWIVAGLYLLCCIYLATIVLVKYAAFPHAIQLPQVILFGVSILLPPFLLATLPWFYVQAVKKLKPVLP